MFPMISLMISVTGLNYFTVYSCHYIAIRVLTFELVRFLLMEPLPNLRELFLRSLYSGKCVRMRKKELKLSPYLGKVLTPFYAYIKKKTLWPLFMDGVQLTQD